MVGGAMKSSSMTTVAPVSEPDEAMRTAGDVARAEMTDGKGAASPEWGRRSHEAVMRIPVSVRFVIGATRMSVSKLMSLHRGAVIPLDRKVGDLVDIVVNDKTVARGEVVVLDQDNDRFAIAVRELVRDEDR